MSVDPKLIEYITQARVSGMTVEQIRVELSKAGWDQASVDEATRPLQPTPPPAVAAVSPQINVSSTQPTQFKTRKSYLTFIITVVLLLIVGGAVYFFMPQIVSTITGLNSNIPVVTNSVQQVYPINSNGTTTNTTNVSGQTFSLQAYVDYMSGPAGGCGASPNGGTSLGPCPRSFVITSNAYHRFGQYVEARDLPSIDNPNFFYIDVEDLVNSGTKLEVGKSYLFKGDKYSTTTTEHPYLFHAVPESNLQATSTEGWKTYVSTTGLYSFSYPRSWTYSEGTETTRFREGGSGDTASDLTVTPIIGKDALANYQKTIEASSTKNSLETSSISGYSVEKYVFVYKLNYGQYTRVFYVINLGLHNNVNVYLTLFTEIKPGNSTFQGLVAELLKTLNVSIDDQKISRLQNHSTFAQSDAQTKAYIMQFTQVAENYLDNHGYSYTGVCSPEKSATADVAKLFDLVDREVGAENISCFDSKDAYALTGHLKGGDFFCVDSSGYHGIAKTLNVGTICTK